MIQCSVYGQIGFISKKPNWYRSGSFLVFFNVSALCFLSVTLLSRFYLLEQFEGLDPHVSVISSLSSEHEHPLWAPDMKRERVLPFATEVYGLPIVSIILLDSHYVHESEVLPSLVILLCLFHGGSEPKRSLVHWQREVSLLKLILTEYRILAVLLHQVTLHDKWTRLQFRIISFDVNTYSDWTSIPLM